MAYKRLKIGSVLKSKDVSQPDYIKIDVDVVLKKGDSLSLESKKSKLASIEKAVENNKLSEEVAEKMRGFAEKIPDFVRFEIVQITRD